MSKIPRVLLLIESARGFGRSLLRGFSEYARFHGPWCIDTSGPFFRRTAGKLCNLNKDYRGSLDGIVVRDMDELATLRKLGLPTVIASTIEPKAGGKIIWRWKDYGPNFYNVEAHGKVLKADRPSRFVFKWFPVGKEEEGTQITFDIQGQYGGTVIRLTEEGYPDTPDGRAMILECASGWGEALALLKFYLERGVVYIQPEKDS